MPSCPECDNLLDVDAEEIEVGEVVVCEECGSEYEVVAIDPLELARLDEDAYDDEDDDDFAEEEEED